MRTLCMRSCGSANSGCAAKELGLIRLTAEYVAVRSKRCRKGQRNWNVCTPPSSFVPLLNSRVHRDTSYLRQRRHLKLKHLFTNYYQCRPIPSSTLASKDRRRSENRSRQNHLRTVATRQPEDSRHQTTYSEKIILKMI